MKIVNMHEAKTHLSRLVDAAVEGEPFVIAKAGRPLVKVEKVTRDAPRRTGFLKGRIDIPEDFDRLGEAEIRAAFEGGDASPAGPDETGGGETGADETAANETGGRGAAEPQRR